MFGDTEQQFLQIHIDAARNATDDFNPFHDPYKWERIHANPFAGTIALGFQLEMLAAHRLNILREVTGESELLGKHELRFANYQFSFADVVQPEEGFRVDIKSTSNRVSGAGQLANRIALRKGRRLVILGYQRETRQPLNFPDVNFTGLGDLGAILRFAAGKNPPDCLSEAEELDNLISQGSLVAGVPTDYDSIHPTESMD